MARLPGTERIVIVGGGYAGMLAAARAARAGDQVAVTLIDAQPEFVQRLRLHEALAGAVPRTLPYGPLLRRRGVHFIQGYVETLEPRRQQVRGRATDGTALALAYDRLVIALGSSTPAAVPGVTEHAVRLNDRVAITAAQARLRALAHRGGRVLVVGGGLTGIETATELAERLPGLRVSLVTNAPLATGFHATAARHLQHRLRELQIELREGCRVMALEAGLAHTSGHVIPFDLCIWTAGFVAAPLARQAGLAVDDAGRMLVDAGLRAPQQPTIFAAGDAAAVAQGQRFLRMGCVSALPMGGYVGDSLAQLARGGTPQPFAFNFALRCLSLGRRDGLVQFTAADDTPQARVWTGRLAAMTKEAICRMTLAAVHNEVRLGLPLYRWPHGALAQPLALAKEGQ